MASNPVESVRQRIGAALFANIAGAEGEERRARVLSAAGPRRYPDGSPIQQVHGDAAMFVGGVRALLLQSLHPLAMAAVADHSGFRTDPWGRLQRTSRFLAETTFGTRADADRAIRIVKAVHKRVIGTAPDGRPYRADDPRLLLWVHVAELDSFLAAYDRYGAQPLRGADRDEYIAQAASVARDLGAVDVPTTEAELRTTLAGFRPDLRGTADARRGAWFLLVRWPVPLPMRVPYSLLCAAAVGTLPLWARRQLRLPYLPITEATTVRAAATAVTGTIRWALRPAA